MTAGAAELRDAGADSVETPSGKWRRGENFPVGSLLIRRDLRAHVHAFYRFARNADDIADNPALTADDKVRRLDRMAAILDGAPGRDSPAASAMRESSDRDAAFPRSIATTCCTPFDSTRQSCAIATGTI